MWLKARRESVEMQALVIYKKQLLGGIDDCEADKFGR